VSRRHTLCVISILDRDRANHIGRVTTGHPAHAHAPGMDRMTSTAPIAVARIARALIYLV
jgi:hypothetical protein